MHVLHVLPPSTALVVSLTQLLPPAVHSGTIAHQALVTAHSFRVQLERTQTALHKMRLPTVNLALLEDTVLWALPKVSHIFIKG